MSMIRQFCILIVVLSFANFGMASAMSTFMPGAHSVVVKELDDITTLNTKDVFPPANEPGRIAVGVNDWVNGKPVRAAWNVPQQPVPGYQITGMYEDSRFVIRIPKSWNGKLIIAASPGIREETAADTLFSDFAVTHFDANGNSYAYACTDKGICGELIPDTAAGETSAKAALRASTIYTYRQKPDDPAFNDSPAEWGYRMRQLTVGAKEAIAKLKGKAPERTYLMGCSNGGYVVRWSLEHNEDNLWDGGVDWEGVLWRADDNNLIAAFHELVMNELIYNNRMKKYTGKDATPEERAAAKAVIDKWLPPSAEDVWNSPFNAYYPKGWLFNLALYSRYSDPDFLPNVSVQWSKLGTDPMAYKDWDYYKRPASVRKAFRQFENTGKINKPLITVQGTWDVLIPVSVSSVPYRALVEKNGKADIHRLYLIENGTHLDGWCGAPKYDPDNKLRVVMPYAHQAFDILVDWVENGKSAPANMTVPVTSPGKVIDLKTGNEITPY